MDNETKQIFEQLIEAINNNRVDSSQLVEAVNSPDWWSIAATFFAAVVAAGITWHLGKRQNKLQQQQVEIQKRQNDLQEQQVKLQEQQNEIQRHQTKLQEQQVRAQEYEILKRLYILVSKANRLIDNFIEDLDMSLWEPCYNSNKDALSNKITHIDNLLKDLRDSYIDYELKLSKETFNKDGYLRILDLMSRLLLHTIKSLEKGEAHLTQGCQTVNSVNGDMEEGHIRHICSHFQEGYMLSALYHNLKQFAKLKKEVRCNDSLLERIRAKFKID